MAIFLGTLKTGLGTLKTGGIWGISKFKVAKFSLEKQMGRREMSVEGIFSAMVLMVWEYCGTHGAQIMLKLF